MVPVRRKTGMGVRIVSSMLSAKDVALEFFLHFVMVEAVVGMIVSFPFVTPLIWMYTFTRDNMDLFIQGDIKDKNLVEIYIVNVLKHLKIDRRKSTEIIVKFRKKMPKGFGDSVGLCEGDREECIVYISNKQNFFEQMLTLAHELVHAKQFLKGEYPSEMEAKSQEYDLLGRCFPWERT